MSDLMPEPSLVLETMQDVAIAVDQQLRQVWKKQPHPFQWQIKSLWLIDLIDEIVAAGQYPYNSVVKKAAETYLGYPPQPDRHYSASDTLSLLIYNAQNFRHSDHLRAAGFEQATEALLERAYREKRKIKTTSGNVLTVRQVGGKLYAFKPRKRKWATDILGYPALLLK